MADKILNSFDVWIAAQGWKSRLRLKSIDNISLEGIAKLRELIFELAIRGKLVHQNPTDEPARLFMERIAMEKEQLVKVGRIKKQEPLSKVDTEQTPFDLPAAWIWTKLGNVSSNVHYGYTASANQNNKGVRLLRITDIQNDSVDWDTVPGCEIDDKSVSDYLLEDGDILIARTGGTIGKSYLVSNITLRSVFASYLIRVKKLDKMYPDFIKVFLGSKLYWDQLIKNSMGTGQPNVNGNALKNLTIPIPPLQEQHRIVAKVDELMALCDELEQEETNHLKSHQLLVETLLGTLTQAKDAAGFQTAWATLAQHFDDLFITEDSIDQLKQTILQLAVMGKLVKQDPKDEPATVLLEKIANEKKRLIDDGEIKSQKPLPIISNDDKPYIIPKHWEFSRLGEVTNYGLRDQVDPEAIDENEWVLELEDIEKITSNLLQTVYAKDRVPKSSRNRFYKGDVLYGKLRPYLDKVVVANNDGVCTTEMIPLRGYTGITSEYLRLVMKSPYFVSYASESTHGMNLPRLGTDKARLALMPLAPMNEQKRIVTRVEELFALCDGLKERIKESQKVVNQMADSILEQVV